MGLFSKAVNFLGMGDEAPATPTATSSVSAAPAAARTPRVTSIRSRRPSADILEIHSLDPKSFEESKEIAAWFREGVPVIVNIGALSETDARKMFYFLLGLKEGLDGHMKRITAKVFVLTPNHVDLNDEDELTGDSDDLVQP